jgi:hypothetical protein
MRMPRGLCWGGAMVGCVGCVGAEVLVPRDV